MRPLDASQLQRLRRRRRIRAGEPIALWLRVAGLAVALYLVLPTLFVIPMSWGEATTFVFPPRGFTFRLYENFFTDPRWIGSLGHSILVATLASALATVVGTAAALGLNRLRGKVVGYLRAILMVPIVTPSIVIATSIYISFLMWGLVGTLTGYVLAHAAIATPFVIVSVTSALGTFDPRLLRAAASLGASPLRAFTTVTLPLISRGVATGAVLAFVTSFDEVVIALFIRAPDFQTLPVQMYNSVTVEIDPTVAASSSLIVTTVSIVLLVGMVVGFTRRRS
ncbi:ABC transporter permease [Chelatococcus sp. GCM10030263]|uniref:ABC transporter permease n=1 Tax=Chelatococcus sp. GCM10030263 TaxID=3273387 RepID=UPI003607BCE8